jgi:hypothetical protein
MTEDKPAGKFRRWLAAFYAGLLESSRLCSVDWMGCRVDWEVYSRPARTQRLSTRWR